MSTPTPMIQPRSLIADEIAYAIARATGIRPHQIISVTAGTEQIVIIYTGAEPGLGGGHGRVAVQTWDTKTGRLISDELVRSERP